MVLEIGEPARLGEDLFVAEIVKELDNAARGQARPLQIGDGGLVGGGLLAAGLGHGPERPEILRAGDQGYAGVRRACDGGQNPQAHADQEGFHPRLFHVA